MAYMTSMTLYYKSDLNLFALFTFLSSSGSTVSIPQERQLTLLRLLSLSAGLIKDSLKGGNEGKILGKKY
jgi:hypothetical protein